MHIKKLSSLQYLRAIAALLVVLYHASGLYQQYYDYTFLIGIFDPGYMGVDIFFVLSGFIICMMHLKDIGHQDKAKLFFQKRFIRIYPIYWTVLIFLIPIYFIFPAFGIGYETEFSEVISSVLLLPTENMPILNVAWTLQHEMLFYLLFGFLFIILFSSYKKITILIFTLWIILSFSSFFLNIDAFHPLYRLAFNPLNFEFLMGCLIVLYINKRKTTYPQAMITGGASLLILLFVWIMDVLGVLSVHRTISWGIPAALLLFSLVTIENTKGFKQNKFLGFLGDASFSIYLTHYLALSFLNKIFSFLNLHDTLGYSVTIILSVLIAVAAGCLFHVLVEKKLLKTGRNFIQNEKIGEANTPFVTVK